MGIRCADHATPSIRKSWHYFASVGIVRSRTKATEFSFSFLVGWKAGFGWFNRTSAHCNKKFWEELPLIRHGPHRKQLVQQFFYCCMCIRCRGNVFTEPLPSSDRDIHTDIDWWERFMIYAVGMGLGAMIYIPSFIKIGSGIQKLMGGGDTETHRQHGDRISLL
jgi:hypothetical protein